MAIEPLSRRSALRGCAVAAASAVVGFVVARAAGAQDPGPATAANAYGPEPAQGKALARLDDVPAGGGLVVADDKIVLIRGAGDSVRAFSAICNHQGCPVSGVAEGAIVCPCHGSRFSPEDGSVLDGPATRPLASIGVTVRDGSVYPT